jgi:maltose/moltooligosaccharide transporter
VLGGLGLVSLRFVHDPNFLVVSMALVGIAWASILSMPYAMLAGALPANKMGYYMGVFNFFIVTPQIIASVGLGFLTKYVFQGNTLYALVLGGVGMIIGGLLTLRVQDNDDIRLPLDDDTAPSPAYDTPIAPSPVG